MNREDLPPTVPPGEVPPDAPRGLMARFRNYFLTGLIVYKTLRAGARWTVLDPSGPLADLTRLPELAPSGGRPSGAATTAPAPATTGSRRSACPAAPRLAAVRSATNDCDRHDQHRKQDGHAHGASFW